MKEQNQIQRKKDFVFTGLQSWDMKIGGNAKNIALEISKNNNVLYVNPPIDRISKLKTRFRKNNRIKEKHLEQISENLWVLRTSIVLESISRLPFNKLFSYLNKINNKRFSKEINAAILTLNFKDTIHLCDSDILRSFHLKETMRPNRYIYYSRDNLMDVPYWQAQGKRIEPFHMEKADIVLTNSEYLCNKAKQFNANSFCIGQGVDLKDFDIKKPADIPEEIRELNGPIIGYTGVLKTLRLSIPTIKQIAISHPEWHIVLVGPEDNDFKNSELHAIDNIHFTGSKAPEELHRYIRAFSVAINPQSINPITIGNYPRKIDEYLALGKPVVATKTEGMLPFADHCYLAESIEEWGKLIQQAITEDSPTRQESRIKLAQSHTWTESVNKLYKHLEECS